MKDPTGPSEKFPVNRSLGILDSFSDLFFFCSMARHKGANQKPTLISRLRGQYDHGWDAKEFVPPPEIQTEAADELQRLEYRLSLHKNYLIAKGLFAEFLEWADTAVRKLSK
jgi:hypothetical protein